MKSIVRLIAGTVVTLALYDVASAQDLTGSWISEGARAEIEIYGCGAPGQKVVNPLMLETLCGYVSDKGPRVCGRVTKLLPVGMAELAAKGKKLEDVIGHPVLCAAKGIRHSMALARGCL